MTNRRRTHKPPPVATITMMVPKVLAPSEFTAIEIEDGGFSATSKSYVTRMSWGGQTLTNEFDPTGVPFGKIPMARHAANIVLLRRFGLDLAHAERLVS